MNTPLADITPQTTQSETPTSTYMNSSNNNNNNYCPVNKNEINSINDNSNTPFGITPTPANNPSFKKEACSILKKCLIVVFFFIIIITLLIVPLIFEICESSSEYKFIIEKDYSDRDRFVFIINC